MGHKWAEILEKGNTAFQQERYSLAFGYYTNVLEEAKKNLKQLNLLTNNNYQIEGQWDEAETIYKKDSDDLIPFISNFKNGLAYRAFTVTEFKNIFYELIRMYISSHQKKNYKLMFKN